MWDFKPKKITSATLGLEVKNQTSGTLTPLAHAL